jgi:hypothetical protein
MKNKIGMLSLKGIGYCGIIAKKILSKKFHYTVIIEEV